MLPKQISALLIAFLCSTLGFNLNAASLRDPTKPGYMSAKTTSLKSTSSTSMVLNSIVQKGNSAYAVINNQIFTLGGKVKGVKIVHIGKDTVSLADGRKLTLFPAVTDLKGQ
ncbi:MSHA biogenesis protein MshK [Shewanella sp. 125m-7]